jgi:hypothetical protein
MTYVTRLSRDFMPCATTHLVSVEDNNSLHASRSNFLPAGYELHKCRGGRRWRDNTVIGGNCYLLITVHIIQQKTLYSARSPRASPVKMV